MSERTITPAAEGVNTGGSGVAERRVVSVLFVDLVGFTPFAEDLDPEDVREMLAGYFDHCRETIASHGGTVEKFIGDAVMAVWGTPVVREDDAERAVLAGLELVSRIAQYGQQVGTSGLQLRVGVASGEVAVSVGAVGEGMVSGDVVNTAARIQSMAPPGAVWVDDQTAHLSSSTIACEYQGEFQLKGKRQLLRLYQAAAAKHAHGSGPQMDHLAVPLAGYSRELARLRETFHATVDEGRGRLLVVVGEPGVGKTRLAQEFRDYLEGLPASIYWHWGQCPAYGEGIVYTALVHAVRHRLNTTETDPASVVLERIGDVLRELGTSNEELAWLVPRLGALLGVSGETFSREDLFAAWLAWFDVLGRDGSPLVWVVEDAQHADDGLLDFIEHLARTATTPVLILALARPELLDRRPRLGSGRRLSQLNLEGLNDEEMGDLIESLMPDLSPAIRQDVIERADGIPLYAIETVRAMLDVQVASESEPGAGRSLPPPLVPATLQVLIASRLDALPALDREVLLDAAVLGQVFARDDLQFLTGLGTDDLDEVLARLTQRDLVGSITDRFSPYTGRYAFVQAVVRQVAYDLLGRRSRIDRHERIARLAMVNDATIDRAAIVAQHLTYAISLTAAHDPRRQVLIEQRAHWLEQAGDRSRQLGAAAEALQLFDLALEHVADEDVQTRLLLKAGESGNISGHFEVAISRARAVTASDPTTIARVTVIEARALRTSGRFGELAATLERFPTPDSLAAVDPAVASDLAFLRVCAVYDGTADGDGLEWARWAYHWALLAEDPNLLALALTGFSLVYAVSEPAGMDRLSRLYIDEAVRICREHHLLYRLSRALVNQAVAIRGWDLPASLASEREALHLSRQIGAYDWSFTMDINVSFSLKMAGEWDECLDLTAERWRPENDGPMLRYEAAGVAALLIRHARGENLEVPATWRVLTAAITDSPDLDLLASIHQWRTLTGATPESPDFDLLATIRYLDGDIPAAASIKREDVRTTLAWNPVVNELGTMWTEAMDLSIQARHMVEARELLAVLEREPFPLLNRYLQAALPAWRGVLALTDPDSETPPETIAADLRAGIDGLDRYGAVPEAARMRSWFGRWLLDQGRVEEGRDVLAAAAATFRALGAKRWLNELPAEFHEPVR